MKPGRILICFRTLGITNGHEVQLLRSVHVRHMRWTYDPSGLLDSGITRSRVRGSSAIPASVLSGLIGGLDIFMLVYNAFTSLCRNDNWWMYDQSRRFGL